MTSIALAADGVSHRFGATMALDKISIDVAAGSALALVGESGSGKTTLLRCFNRMITPERGVVRVGEQDARALDPIALRRRIGYVQQHGGLLPHWTVAQNVGLVLRASGISRDSAQHRDAVAEALTFVGLDPALYAGRFPRALSGGQRQRVALARALAARPDALLLDEPFGALDAISKADVQDAFDRARRALGVTTILVTHDLAEAARLGDEIAVMRAARVEQRGTMRDLRDAPATEYVRELLAKARASLEAIT